MGGVRLPSHGPPGAAGGTGRCTAEVGGTRLLTPGHHTRQRRRAVATDAADAAYTISTPSQDNIITVATRGLDPRGLRRALERGAAVGAHFPFTDTRTRAVRQLTPLRDVPFVGKH